MGACDRSRSAAQQRRTWACCLKRQPPPVGASLCCLFWTCRARSFKMFAGLPKRLCPLPCKVSADPVSQIVQFCTACCTVLYCITPPYLRQTASFRHAACTDVLQMMEGGLLHFLYLSALHLICVSSAACTANVRSCTAPWYCFKDHFI